MSKKAKMNISLSDKDKDQLQQGLKEFKKFWEIAQHYIPDKITITNFSGCSVTFENEDGKEVTIDKSHIRDHKINNIINE